MLNRRHFCFGLPFTAIFLGGCGTEPSNSKPKVAPADDGKVTFRVDGMMEKFNIL
jgi:hypothetical protein